MALRQTNDTQRPGLAPWRISITCATVILGFAFGARADDPAAVSSAISSEELDEAIARVIEQPQYAWRLPREAPPDTEKGFVTLFIESVAGVIEDFVERIVEGIKRFSRWLRELLPDRSEGPTVSWGGLTAAPQVLMYLLLAVVTVLLATWLIRLIRQRTRTHHVDAESAPDLPDIEAEETMADELPEDGWLALARDLIERGEPRLALRALFLATLARLDGIQLIRIARFKSNRDYLRELERRAWTEPDLRVAFLENMALFEKVWYGAHEATPDRVRRFTENQNRIHPRG
jgi:hypothetical protein